MSQIIDHTIPDHPIAVPLWPSRNSHFLELLGVGDMIAKLTVLTALLGIAAGICTAAPATETISTKPNIIMFLIDDQDFDQIGAFGGETYTPNLDRMAREGMRFTQAYVSSTVCTPSRYSFLTGRYAGNAYDPSYLKECPKGNQGFVAFNVGLESDNMNIGAVLSANGYATGYVGKYHVHGGEKADGEDLIKKGKADDRTAALCKAEELACREEILKRGFSWAKHVYWGNMTGPWGHHNPDWTMDAALEFIELNKDRPFYLHYCPTLLHGPDKSWRKSIDHPECTGQGPVQPSAELLSRRREFLALLKAKGIPDEKAGETWIDANLGLLMAKLKELGIDRNTLVVFAPDHGRDNKGALYGNDGARVPLIMRWPATIPAGRECDQFVQNIDMAPTFFELTGTKVPDSYRIDGRSLTPLFKTGRADPWRDHLYFEIGCGRAVLTRDWKYIATRYTQEDIAAIKQASPSQLPKLMAPSRRMGIGVRGADHPGFWNEDQLYDIRRDPGELNNLADQPEYAAKLRDMRATLTGMIKPFDRPFGELITGGNAAAAGQIDDQRATLQQLTIKGKKVTVPPELGGDETVEKRDRRKKKKDS